MQISYTQLDGTWLGLFICKVCTWGAEPRPHSYFEYSNMGAMSRALWGPNMQKLSPSLSSSLFYANPTWSQPKPMSEGSFANKHIKTQFVFNQIH